MSEDRVIPGFYDEPRTELTDAAHAAVKGVYKHIGAEIGEGGLMSSNARVAVFVMRLMKEDGTEATEADLDDENLAEDIGVAFGGFESPWQMIEHLIHELEHMSARAGIKMPADMIRGPADLSQN
jgi:hypothetical protein